MNREEPSNLPATLSECEEAADTEGDDVVKLIDRDNMDIDNHDAEISLSWMHDAPAQASHVSGSLPTYFREVLGLHANQSTATNLQASALPGDDDMQFKSFPNLLPAHEIYKLVQVTPGVAAGAVGIVSAEKQTVPSPLKARPFTPQLSGSISDRDIGERSPFLLAEFVIRLGRGCYWVRERSVLKLLADSISQCVHIDINPDIFGRRL